MINLSYALSHNIPVYGGGASPEIRSGKSILKGDSCNTMEIAMSNHTGTHIDLPAHFDAFGKTVTDFPPGFWFSENIECIFLDQQYKPGEIIGISHLRNRKEFSVNNDVEVLLLKTNFYKKRSHSIYWEKPPGLDSALPDFLRKSFPNLRFLGMDLISVSSFANRDEGRRAHLAFLKHSQPILPIEDMNLCDLPKVLSNILISPLFIQNADGVPCTVFANIGL